MKARFSLILLLLLHLTMAEAQQAITVYPAPGKILGFFNLGNRIFKADNSDKIWFASNFGLPSVYSFNSSNQTWNVFDSTNSSLTGYGSSFSSIWIDENNHVWISSKRYGVFHYDGITFHHYDSTNNNLPTNIINDICVRNNVVWLASNNGLIYGTPGNWQVYNTSNSNLAHNDVLSIAINDNNAIGLLLYKSVGFQVLQNNNWTTYPYPNGNYQNNPNDIQSANGAFYFWRDKDLYQFDNGSFYKISSIYKNEIVYPTLSYFIRNQELFSGNLFKLDSLGIKWFYNSRINQRFTVDSQGRVWNIVTGVTNDSLICFDPKYYDDSLSTFIETYTNQKKLNINGVSAMINNDGTMHWDYNYSKYVVPKESGKTAVFTSSLWIGCLDAGNNIHLTAQTYKQAGEEMWPGPIDTTNATIDSVTMAKYNFIYEIKREEIETFKYNFKKGDVQNGNYHVPLNILMWPGNGSNNLAKTLAPFFDNNNDGFYNPYDGDYPKMKGDQMMYWIMNDTYRNHTQSFGTPLGVEIHASAYSYSCPKIDSVNETMNYSTFYNYEITNRSDTDYHDVYIGLWLDVDLGIFHDDYIGCDTLLNAGFVYNGDNDDDGYYGYGLNPPMLNVQILKGPQPVLNDGLDNDNDSLIDEPAERCMMTHYIWNRKSTGMSIWGTPQIPSDYYNMLRMHNFNGNPITYGDDGLNPNNPPTNHFFSGIPFTWNGWTETSAMNPPGDRRLMLSTGPFNLASHQSQTVDFAYVFTRDTTAPNGVTTSVAKNKRELLRVKNWFDTDSFPSCLKFEFPPIETNLADSSILVFPNPTMYSITLNIDDDYLNSATAKIYNAMGQICYNSIITSKTIGLEKLRNGIYWIQVEKDGDMKSAKFLKQGQRN